MISLKKLLDIVATEAIEGKTVNPRFGNEPEIIYHQLMAKPKDNKPKYENGSAK